MDNWIFLLFGGGVIGSIVTAFFSRISSKEKNSTDNNKELWDRTYKLIEYQEEQIEIQRKQLSTFQVKSEKDEEIKREMQETIRNLENSNRELKRELEQGKKEREHGK